MSSADPIITFILLVIVAGVLLSPIILLKLKGGIRNGKKSIFHTVGTLRLRASGSMVPTHRFDIFLDGLLISSLFYVQFISAKNIRTVTRTKSMLKPYIELELKSGEYFYIATFRKDELLHHLKGEFKF